MDDLTGEIDAAESLIAELADEYLERLEQGERPDVEQYVARWPGDPRVVRQVLASLKLVRLSEATEISEAAVETADAAGRLGDFQLLRELGRGGMGVVYEAEQISLGRRVALKILPFAAMLDPRQLQRFKNEAQAAAQLDHPNIVDVIAVGCDRGIHYYAMRLIDGPTLAQVIAELEGPGFRVQGSAEITREDDCKLQNANCKSQIGASGGELSAPRLRPKAEDLRPDTRTSLLIPKSTLEVAGLSTDRTGEYYRSAARLMADAAEALDHAHQAGVIHRDIKPSNLMLDSRGKVWITDFGLARVESNSELTMTGDLLGTLRYMSPEQLLGQRAAVDHRTDIYSLGATLYELLTLRPVFSSRDRAELLRRIAVEPPRSPRKLNRSLPAELETIVLKVLEKNPGDRYRTAGELADDLQRFLDHRPIHARRSRVVAHAKAIWRRHQALFVSMLATLLVASSIASVLIWRQRQEAVEQRGLVVEREADLRQRLYVADMKQVHQAWQRGDVPAPRNCSTATRPRPATGCATSPGTICHRCSRRGLLRSRFCGPATATSTACSSRPTAKCSRPPAGTGTCNSGT